MLHRNWFLPYERKPHSLCPPWWRSLCLVWSWELCLPHLHLSHPQAGVDRGKTFTIIYTHLQIVRERKGKERREKVLTGWQTVYTFWSLVILSWCMTFAILFSYLIMQTNMQAGQSNTDTLFTKLCYSNTCRLGIVSQYKQGHPSKKQQTNKQKSIKRCNRCA